MEFRPGQKVRIREDMFDFLMSQGYEPKGTGYGKPSGGLFVTDGMIKKAGQEVIVQEKTNMKKDRFRANGYYWLNEFAVPQNTELEGELL